MQTPKEYVDNLNKGIITEKMLVDCLYSCNKRAKNYRDNERDLRYFVNNTFYDDKGYINRVKKEKEKYYEQKEKLLSLLKPTCIHKEFLGYEKRKIYDYEKDFKSILKDKKCNIQKEYDCNLCRLVKYIEVKDINKPRYNYYLFYDMIYHSFHTPIEEEDLKDFDYLKIIEINHLDTKGQDINLLLSNQFVCKVIDVINENKYCLA